MGEGKTFLTRHARTKGGSVGVQILRAQVFSTKKLKMLVGSLVSISEVRGSSLALSTTKKKSLSYYIH